MEIKLFPAVKKKNMKMHSRHVSVMVAISFSFCLFGQQYASLKNDFDFFAGHYENEFSSLNFNITEISCPQCNTRVGYITMVKTNPETSRYKIHADHVIHERGHYYCVSCGEELYNVWDKRINLRIASPPQVVSKISSSTCMLCQKNISNGLKTPGVQIYLQNFKTLF